MGEYSRILRESTAVFVGFQLHYPGLRDKILAAVGPAGLETILVDETELHGIAVPIEWSRARSGDINPDQLEPAFVAVQAFMDDQKLREPALCQVVSYGRDS